MSVSIKSEHEIALMRESCHILEKVHEGLAKYVKPGISTGELNKIGDDLIRSYGCVPNFLDYAGFPGSFCMSVNEVVVHGIPSYDKIIQEGDLLKIDAGLIYKGYHSDAARTYCIGEVSPELEKLVEVTRASFFEGISHAKAGGHLNDICSSIEAFIRPHHYGIVTAMCGHGIGTHLHEDPEIPNVSMNRRGIRLLPGMTLAVEPMVNLGTGEVTILDDGWTCVTDDGLPSAHYENTILITDGEPEILTLTHFG